MANMPIVEYFHRAPVPEKSGKLPEWAKIVTVVTIFAFVTSSYYVNALSRALEAPLATYFSPADYLRITPSWAIPTLGVSVLVVLLFVMVFATISAIFKVPKGGISPILSWQAVFDYFPNHLKRSRSAFVFMVLMALPINAVLLVLPVDDVFGAQFRMGFSTRVASSVIECFVFYTFVGVSFLPGSAAIKGLLIAIVWCAALANGVGYYVKPNQVGRAPSTRVYFESEKDKDGVLEGKVIFDLDRYLLLNTGHKSVVAIPHERIKSIQTPPLPKEQEQKSAGD
jgi:hypothetical protein